MKRHIIFTETFTATHNWSECNILGKEYLRLEHRHRFHVKVKLKVNHNDRDLEFITEQERLKSFLDAYYEGFNLPDKSCEMIAEEIGKELWPLCVYSVEVWEDNENGAEIVWE